MQRQRDFEAMYDDVAKAIEKALAKHGIDSLYNTLGLCVVLEAIASPLKHQQTVSPLTQKMGELGVKVYSASSAPRAVEMIDEPRSSTVNILMHTVVAALVDNEAPLTFESLKARTIRLLRDHSSVVLNELAETLVNDADMDDKFSSALRLLQNGGLVSREPDGGTYQYNGPW